MPIPEFIVGLRRKVGTDLLFIPSVVVIVRDEAGRILVVKDRDSGYWTVIGGIIEPGEVPADAAVREVWEEARVHARLTRIAGVEGGPQCETHYSNGDRLAWVATIFSAEAHGAVPVSDGAETLDARFVTEAELAGLDLRADSQRFLAAERASAGGAWFQPASWAPQA